MNIEGSYFSVNYSYDTVKFSPLQAPGLCYLSMLRHAGSG